jgi:hypothetical protein
MKIMERHVHAVYPGKWDELMKLEKKFDAVEKRYGFPPKRSYQCISGSQIMGSFVIEREWDSLAALEVGFEKVMADPEWQALSVEMGACEENPLFELYLPVG